MARVRVEVPVEKPITHHQTEPNSQINQALTKKNIIKGLVVLVALVGFFMLWNDRNQLKEEVKKQSSSQSSQNDTQKYHDAVSKLVQVPTGITPTVKVPTQDEITNLSRDNSLYNTAKAGDVFLVYTNQDKSLFLVIYRPSDGKVILATQASTANTQP